MVAHFLHTEGVVGSNPTFSIEFDPYIQPFSDKLAKSNRTVSGVIQTHLAITFGDSFGYRYKYLVIFRLRIS